MAATTAAAGFISWHQRQDQTEQLPLPHVAHSTSSDWLREGEHSGNGSEQLCDAIQLIETLSWTKRKFTLGCLAMFGTYVASCCALYHVCLFFFLFLFFFTSSILKIDKIDHYC